MPYSDRMALMRILADDMKRKQELIESKTHKLE